MTNPSKITRWLTLVLLGVASLALIYSFGSTTVEDAMIPVSQLAQEVEANEVAELQVTGDGQQVDIVYQDREPPAGQHHH